MDWDYNEIKLQGNLSEIIDCIWWENYSDVHPKNNQHKLIPDHTIELIFTNYDIKRFLPLTEEYKIRKSQLAGLRTVPQICTIVKSPIISIRFIPKTFYRLCKTEIGRTINNNLDPRECFGESILDLEKDIFKTTSQKDRIHLIESYFNKYLNSQCNNSDEDFEKFVIHIETNKGNCKISDFPKLFNTSASTIERKFKKHLGLTPKKYSMLVRFSNQFLSRVKAFSALSFNDGFNYYDQAHFIKEMSKFSGLTPKQLTSIDIGIQQAYFRNNSN
ncbi:helix-turn-helix domain-containing protein [Saccharicrinis sp. FJH54]|uniref:helix-turn-helix domain-containing protein n=1 Tax=Saccharicrinis sp. FJH54 TaxID=3344665 RepID=UPI0035D50E3D